MRQLLKPKSLEAFVMDIFFMENKEPQSINKLPFYAEGFPGIIFSKSQAPFYLQPRNKKLADFYLYGQTIDPISLDVLGPYELICMRLYPFVARILLGVNPKVLNDDCFDLRLVKHMDTAATIEQLRRAEGEHEMLVILESYFNALLQNASLRPDYRVQLATNLILKSGGKVSIKALREQLAITERTLERKFRQEIGVTPKQFAKIIQFSATVKQMTDDDYVNLTEVGYDNGFADQSHFIRSFKRYTGKTPKEFQHQLSL